MKKYLLLVLTALILICTMIINVCAESFVELSTNDLFIKYPYYLDNAETNAITQRATDTYHGVMSDYDENDEFISAIKSGVSSSVETVIRDIGSWLGLTDSYYETCMDTATIELMQTLYADENLIAGLDVVKKSSEILEDVKNVSEITAVKSCEIAAALENLSESDVLAMTEELVENCGDVLDATEDAVNIAKYIYTACIITDVQIEMIDILMERIDKNGELYEGLSRLRHQMSYNIVEYTGLTFIKNKGLAYISEAVTKLGLNAFGISTGPFLIGQIIAKTAVWVMFDIIYPHPGADEVISNMIHSMYVMEIETSLMNQRLAFYEPFYVSDMEAYETFFSVYLAALKTTLESTKELAKEEYIKQRLENAKQDLEDALPNYEAYIDKCKNEVLQINETERIIRSTDQTMYTSGTTVIGDPGELKSCRIIPVSSNGTTYWNMNVGGNLTVNTPVTFPTLTLNGTLDVNADIIIEGNFNNSGTLKMEHDNDYVLVKGEYSHPHYYQSGASENLTAGVLEIKGDINATGYKPTGTHKTILSGDKKQSVSMSSSYYWGVFNILELANTSEEGIMFGNARVSSELYSNGGVVQNSQNLRLTGTAKICDEWEYPIGLSYWQTVEDITFDDDVYIYNTVVFNHDVNIKEELHLDEYNILEMNNAKLTVEERFTNRGRLKMEHDNDYVLVKGEYSHPHYYQSGASENLTAGVLEIKGDINATGYKPTGTHKTILSGDKKQSVSMSSSYYWGVFNILELANTSEEGITFGNAYVTTDIIQPTGTKLINSNYVQLQNKPAFVDYGELNSAINRFNGNAENVIPTWLDYERYCKFALDGDEAFTLNETITDTAFACDLYFDDEYDKKSAVVIVVFYDGDNHFVQMASKPVEVKAGKIDVSIEYENKPYSKYKIMVWESFNNLKPLMSVE